MSQPRAQFILEGAQEAPVEQQEQAEVPEGADPVEAFGFKLVETSTFKDL